MLYEEASHVDAEKAFSWVDEVDSHFDSDEGVAFLTNEAEKKLGRRSEACRNLKVLRQTRNLEKLGDGIATLAATVSSMGDLTDLPSLEE